MNRNSAGLSLIELLVVVAILAAIAGMVVSLSDKLDSRNRQEETARRLLEIRSAILGPDAVSAGGDLLAGGYLQEVGWLPDCAADLLRPPEIAPGTTLPQLAYYPLWRTWAGWRGPYLAAPPRRRDDAANALYDDWGNDFYGWFAETESRKSWEIPRVSGAYPLRSRGADGRVDEPGGEIEAYARDWPAAEQPLIGEGDWLTDARGLQVEMTNLTATDYAAAPVPVRFRIVVPRWDHPEDPLGFWPADPDADEFIGRAFTLDLASAGDALGRDRRLFAFGDPDRPLRLPHGRRLLFLVREADGRPLAGVQACAELLVSRRLSPPSWVRLLLRN